MRSRAIAVTALAATAGLIGSLGVAATPATAALPNGSNGSGGAGAANGTSAAALYRQALTTMQGATLHYVSRSSGGGLTLRATGNAGPASGTQTINLVQGGATQQARFIVIGGSTYAKGNVAAMTSSLGLSPTRAAQVAGKWVAFATDNPAFASVVAGIRTHDVTEELVMQGPFTLGATRTLHGQRVDPVHGTQLLQGPQKTVKTDVVLYVSARGRHLPVEEDTLDSSGQQSLGEHIVFSHFGEKVRPRAPHATVNLGPINAA